MNDLSSATVPQLLDELHNRFASCVFCAVPTNSGEHSSDARVFSFCNGDPFTCAGLTTVLTHRVRESAEANTTHISADF